MTSTLGKGVVFERLPDNVLAFTLQDSSVKAIKEMFAMMEKVIDYTNPQRTHPDLILIDTNAAMPPLIPVYDELINFYEQHRPPPSRVAVLLSNNSIITSAINLIVIAVSRYQRDAKISVFRLYERQKALEWLQKDV